MLLAWGLQVIIVEGFFSVVKGPGFRPLAPLFPRRLDGPMSGGLSWRAAADRAARWSARRASPLYDVRPPRDRAASA